MNKFKIKHYSVFLLLLLKCNIAYTEEQLPSTSLTEEPQTLGTEDSIESENTKESAPLTETISNIKEADPEVESAIVKKKKNDVLSEEELLKPKQKKETDKVITQKINESEIFIQESDKYRVTDNFKSLKLNDVIEQGLRKNYDQGILNQKENLTELTFESTKNSFYYPNIKLVLSTDSQLMSVLHKSSRAKSHNNSKSPTGYIGLDFGDYTVFNWGKDYALYLNSKSTFTREKEVYLENKRELKLDLIYNFFNLVTTKNIEKIKQDQLRHASFIYRLNKEKITIGKTSQQDYYQSRSEYLRAQAQYHEARMQADIDDENMAYKIVDDVGTKYTLTEGLSFKRIKISLSDALTMATSKNPNLLNGQTSLANAERLYDVAQKENLPLPKFTINLGAYNKTFGPTTNKTIHETANGNANLELVASINATWDIVGDNGLFNSTKLAKSRINKELVNYELIKNKHYAESMVRETYKNILAYQNQMLIYEARLPSVQKTFDTVLENYLNGKAKYNDFHLILIELAETKVAQEQLKLNHLKQKIILAKLMGVEDFSGENFEHLAIKTKGK